MKEISKFNKSKCPDPTAYEALSCIQNAKNEEEERMKRTIKTVKWIIELAGFDLCSRIELRDKKSGKIYL